MIDPLSMAGIPVYVNQAACRPVLVQAKTHRKRRINKKWRKRYGMRSVGCGAAEEVLRAKGPSGRSDAFYCCPHAWERLKAEVRRLAKSGDLTPRAAGG